MTFILLLETICASMAFALSCLAIAMLALRKDPNGIYRPLILFFVANAFIEAVSIFGAFPEYGYFTQLFLVAEIISIPAFLLLAPALWFYVRGLTSETKSPLSRRDSRHFVPFVFGVIACSLLLFSPASIRHEIIGDGDGPHTLWINILTTMIILIMILWASQVVAYNIALLRRLSTYRARLKDVFASTEGRELRWLVWLIALLVATVLIILPDLLIGFPEPISFIPSVFNVALIGFLALWGLRQRPGFIASGETELPRRALIGQGVTVAETDHVKYEKSALTKQDTDRIAKKIDGVMTRDQIYLDPNLSLRSLAKHISTPPNYVSQTLNGHMGESFFDYINRWRIEHAKPLLISTDETVLNITYDVGFNSRSSFYKAFKKETGKTPTAFRSAGHCARA